MKDQCTKDKADRCIKIAEDALSTGNVKKAEEYLLQAESLCPSARGKELMQCVRAVGKPPNGSKEIQASTSSGAPTQAGKRPTAARAAVPPQNSPKRQRPFAREVPQNTSEQPRQRDYTEDQRNAVNRILRCNDFYKILGISKEASECDVIKAYKKLAVLVHPDKNRAPGATKAFQMLGNAVEILRDADKRKEYDKTEEQVPETCVYDYTRGFKANLSAEEVFCMFFGTTLVAAGAYAGYKVGGALTRQKQPKGDEPSEPREPSPAEALGQMAGVAVGGLAAVALYKALTK